LSKRASLVKASFLYMVNVDTVQNRMRLLIVILQCDNVNPIARADKRFSVSPDSVIGFVKNCWLLVSGFWLLVMSIEC